MSRRVYVGVDGGGTKTLAVLVDEAGSERARVQTTTSNAAVVGHEAAGLVLRSVIDEAVRQAGEPVTIAAAWLGLSGGDRPDDHRRLRPYIEDLTPEIRMSNDAELILGALPDAVGLAIVSGTGSIAFGRNAAGERVRAGGWGQIIGDEGSGYDLARRMFAAYAAEVDGRGPATSLTGRLMGRLALAEPHELIAWVYRPETSKGDLAGLSPIVIEEADRGDPIAVGIIEGSAAELATTAAAAARRLGFAHRLPLALTGGLLVNVERFRAIMLASLRREWQEIDYQIVTDPALTAAQALARSHARETSRQ